MACADRQRDALLGHASKAILVDSAVVRSVTLRQTANRPGGRDRNQVRPAIGVEVGRQQARRAGGCRRAGDGHPVESAEPVVEDGNRGRAVVQQHEVEVAVVLEVQDRDARMRPDRRQAARRRPATATARS